MADIAVLTVRINAATGQLTAELKALEGSAKTSLGGLSMLAGTAMVAMGNLASKGLEVAAQAAVQAFRDVIALGDQLDDLTQQTGVGVETLQEWKFAAEQSGTTIDKLAKASFDLGTSLVEGSVEGNKATRTIEALGLSTEALLALDPATQFETVARAIAQLPNPLDQAAAATALFGDRLGRELLPGIKQFDELTEQARRLGVVIDQETLQAAGEFADQMGVLKTQGTALLATALKPMLPVLVEIGKALMTLLSSTGGVFNQITIGAGEVYLAWLRVQLGIAETLSSLPGVGAGFAASATRLKDEINAVTYHLDDLAKGSSKAGAAAAESGAKHSELAKRLAEAEAKTKAKAEADKAAAKAAKDHADAIAKLTGADVLRETATLVTRIQEIGGASRIAATQQDAVNKQVLAAISIYEKQGEIAPKAMYDTAFATSEATVSVKTLQAAMLSLQGAGIQQTADELDDLATITRDYIQANDDLTASIQRAAGQRVRGKVEPTAVPKLDKDKVLAYGEKLGQTVIAAVTGGGDVGKAIGATIGADIFTQSDAIKDAISRQTARFGDWAGKAIGGTLGKGLGAALGAAVPVLGSIAGSALGSIFGKLFGPSEKEKTRDMRNAFYESAGGLAALKEQAEKAGVSLDRIQGAKKTKDFEKAVKDLEQAFAKADAEVKKLMTSLQQTAATGSLLGKDTAAQLAKIRTGTEAAAGAFEFFRGETQRAVGGLQTFLSNATVTSQQSADALVGSFSMLYEDLRLQGLTSAEAIAALGPSLQALNAQLVDAGLVGNEAFRVLLEQTSLASDEIAGPLYTAIGGVGDLLTGLHNTGRLNQELFGGLTSQITDTWSELEKMGKGGTAGLGLIQRELQKVFELQADYGFEVDESTQKLLDMGQESGVVGEQFRSAQDKMVKAIETLVTRMGALVDVLAKALPAAADAGAKGVEDALSRIKAPKITIPVEYSYEGGPSPTPPGAPATAAAPGVRGAAMFPRVVVAIDGERVAEAAARHTPRVLAPYCVGMGG